MRMSCNRRMGVAAIIIAAASLSCAGAALAQQASGAVGGNPADMTSAGNVNGGGMPQIQHQGDIAYVSGGVGLDESTALKHAQHDWPLAMSFTGPGADYLSDVHVRIVGDHAQVLKADARGPYMLVKLPPGRYTVHASYKDDEQTRAITVSKPGSAKADFHWNMQ
ncbi:carboxypeptidase regulatory-like domain-containing protein [Trinickia fusca]|uniref:Carboxypeptidase regulatory-like domain-containing protein n=1 Tax=Trinickia fusca TaxID=2419777 RepID=A0A494XND8_9BURK|nr:carboxypeptidase regulatory-like domain-containing protein [Trinickia fusca]RKP49063.1 carboxypeptidase regulatory-like domain-containing protein [Trinickia fusca]